MKARIGVVFSVSRQAHLKVVIKGYAEASTDLSTSITGELYKDQNNLSADIVGKSYEPPPPDAIPFVFDEPGYVEPATFTDIEWTVEHAEDFWK